MNAFDIIKEPIQSEKCFEGWAFKKYTFKVDVRANKTQIKNAVEEAFKGVKVARVNTVNCVGKEKRRGRTVGMTPKYKKAIVWLTEDSKPIEFFESLT